MAVADRLFVVTFSDNLAQHDHAAYGHINFDPDGARPNTLDVKFVPSEARRVFRYSTLNVPGASFPQIGEGHINHADWVGVKYEYTPDTDAIFDETKGLWTIKFRRRT